MKPVSLTTLRDLKAARRKVRHDHLLRRHLCPDHEPVRRRNLLIGDSLGMVLQGHDSTLPVIMTDMAYHTRCVARGNQGMPSWSPTCRSCPTPPSRRCAEERR
jgi:3-methyl-2-oxobutanoate hydroxymethyltransferase